VREGAEPVSKVMASRSALILSGRKPEVPFQASEPEAASTPKKRRYAKRK
jgi:hypothetical protein